MAPLPKRADQRRRRNVPDVPVTRAPGAAKVKIPTPDPRWHPIALGYFDAFVQSGQSEFFEPSDWWHLIDILDDLSRYKRDGRIGATMRMALDSALARLCVAEGDRRRLRIELDRGKVDDPDEAASVTALNEHVKRFTG